MAITTSNSIKEKPVEFFMLWSLKEVIRDVRCQVTSGRSRVISGLQVLLTSDSPERCHIAAHERPSWKTCGAPLTGGVACYKAEELCRLFIKAGATV